MIYLILRKNINYKNIIKKRFIHNHSYTMLQKELDNKDKIIKELKKDIKKLEYENNRAQSKTNQLEYQRTVDLLFAKNKNSNLKVN